MIFDNLFECGSEKGVEVQFGTTFPAIHAATEIQTPGG